ncbi:MAG TPA: hypothetical protein VD997_17840 [Phycisphaerales bacterium]|nr:hypothetical protein [Phycisphaerales bacterium]
MRHLHHALAVALTATPALAQSCPGHFEAPLQMTWSFQALRDVLTVKQLTNGDIVIGGDGSHQLIHRYSAASGTWSSMGFAYPNTPDGRILALETDAQGRLYAAGETMRMGIGMDAPRSFVALYDSQTDAWAPLAGMPTVLSAWAMFCITRTANGDMIFGGYATFAGPDGSRGSAVRLTPETNQWTVIPTTATASPIMSVLELPNGDLVLAGGGSRIGTATSRYVARFETSTGAWHSMGTGFNDTVQTLKLLPNGDVLALGDFTMADGAPARRVARYSFATNAWTPVGDGLGVTPLSGSVTDAFILPDGDLIASGWFDTQTAWGAARYDAATNQWSGLAGMPYYAEKLTQLQNGNLAIACYGMGANPRPTVAIYNLGFAGDFNNDGEANTDQDIEDFFACLGGHCCATCPTNSDINGDGDIGTDQDIESFFRVLGGGAC